MNEVQTNYIIFIFYKVGRQIHIRLIV